jgi:hypothetical protein
MLEKSNLVSAAIARVLSDRAYRSKVRRAGKLADVWDLWFVLHQVIPGMTESRFVRDLREAQAAGEIELYTDSARHWSDGTQERRSPIRRSGFVSLALV